MGRQQPDFVLLLPELPHWKLRQRQAAIPFPALFLARWTADLEAAAIRIYGDGPTPTTASAGNPSQSQIRPIETLDPGQHAGKHAPIALNTSFPLDVEGGMGSLGAICQAGKMDYG
jgi:hypothetical protein